MFRFCFVAASVTLAGIHGGKRENRLITETTTEKSGPHGKAYMVRMVGKNTWLFNIKWCTPSSIVQKQYTILVLPVAPIQWNWLSTKKKKKYTIKWKNKEKVWIKLSELRQNRFWFDTLYSFFLHIPFFRCDVFVEWCFDHFQLAFSTQYLAVSRRNFRKLPDRIVTCRQML